MSELNKKIREFREDIGQSIEGLALLMQMEPGEFARLEEDWIPPDEILERLCSLFEWNYKDIKRLADNTPNSRPKEKSRGNKQQLSGEGVPDYTAPTPLAGMVRKARNNANPESTKSVRQVTNKPTEKKPQTNTAPSQKKINYVKNQGQQHSKSSPHQGNKQNNSGFKPWQDVGGKTPHKTKILNSKQFQDELAKVARAV